MACGRTILILYIYIYTYTYCAQFYVCVRTKAKNTECGADYIYVHVYCSRQPNMSYILSYR